jgi:hypothetical protein
MSRTIALNLTMDGTCLCNDTTTLTALLTTASVKIQRVSKNSNYTILSSDYLIGADVSSQSITFTLPVASTVSEQIFEIVDEKGNASVNNIILITQGSDTIVGETSYAINKNYTAIEIYSDGGTSYLIK